MACMAARLLAIALAATRSLTVAAKDVLFSLYKESHECLPNGGGMELNLGKKSSVDACAEACIARQGGDCKYFIYGKRSKFGNCWWESAAACEGEPQSFEMDEYDIFTTIPQNCSDGALVSAGMCMCGGSPCVLGGTCTGTTCTPPASCIPDDGSAATTEPCTCGNGYCKKDEICEAATSTCTPACIAARRVLIASCMCDGSPCALGLTCNGTTCISSPCEDDDAAASEAAFAPITGCGDLAPFCNNPDAGPLIRRGCPVTCGDCQPAPDTTITRDGDVISGASSLASIGALALLMSVTVFEPY